MKLKKLWIALLSVLFVIPALTFADEVPPGVSLKDVDMKAFVKNYKKNVVEITEVLLK